VPSSKDIDQKQKAHSIGRQNISRCSLGVADYDDLYVKYVNDNMVGRLWEYSGKQRAGDQSQGGRHSW
jgi:hypothetical protein